MTPNLKARSSLAHRNAAQAKDLWPAYSSKPMLKVLRELTTTFGFSIELGELRIIDGHWYVTHTGLLGIARRNYCSGVRAQIVREYSDPGSARWVFKATVYKSPRSRGFVGYGDADPSNVSSLVHGAEMRMAGNRVELQRISIEPHIENRINLGHVHSACDFAHDRRLLPGFKVGNSAASLFASFRIARSRRNSICRLSERCSCCASSRIFALRLAGMRIRSRAFGSAGGLGMGPTREVIY
jgi:hypothetical protein